MARNSGVLIRQLLGNPDNPCAVGLLHLLHQKPIQNLASVPNTTPSSPHTIGIRSASKPFSNYSIHTPTLQFLQQRRCLSSSSLSESDSDSKHLLSGPSNLFLIQCMAVHQDAVDNVEDARLSAVFYYTAPRCRASCRGVIPRHLRCDAGIYLISQLETCGVIPKATNAPNSLDISEDPYKMNGPGYPIDLRGFYYKENITGSRLDKLGIHKTPTFHCYLKGKRVDEVSGASIKHLKKRLENVYNPSGMKKRRKDENNRGFVTVHPSMFPETSFIEMKAKLRQEIFNFDGEEKMYEEEKMTDDEYKRAKDKNHKMMWFAKGLLSSEKKRKMFCKLKDPEAKREWIESEMAKE